MALELVMADVLCAPVLVLNRYFQAIQVTNARRAFVLLYGGSAVAVEGGELYDFAAWRELPMREGAEEGLSIVGGLLRVPRVVHLLHYDRTPKTMVRLSRKNLMLRDGHQCQYCGRKPPMRDLNIDHVMPRCRGGIDAWDNLVTACRTCNLKKGSRTPDEAGIRLLHTPTRPRWTAAARILLGMGNPYPEWMPFLNTGCLGARAAFARCLLLLFGQRIG